MCHCYQNKYSCRKINFTFSYPTKKTSPPSLPFSLPFHYFLPEEPRQCARNNNIQQAIIRLSLFSFVFVYNLHYTRRNEEGRKKKEKCSFIFASPHPSLTFFFCFCLAILQSILYIRNSIGHKLLSAAKLETRQI